MPPSKKRDPANWTVKLVPDEAFITGYRLIINDSQGIPATYAEVALWKMYLEVKRDNELLRMQKQETIAGEHAQHVPASSSKTRSRGQDDPADSNVVEEGRTGGVVTSVRPYGSKNR